MERRMWIRWLMVSLALATIIFTVGVNPQKPRLGSGINMLNRYGHLAENMRVMTRNVTDTWIYRERSCRIFKSLPPEFFDFFADGVTVLVSFNVQIQFCSNFRELVQEYFRGFKIAGVNESSHAFSSDWSKPAIAKLFGIDESFVADNYSYVLMTIRRPRDTKKMFSFLEEYELYETVVEYARNVEINNTASADGFISRFGSHYVSSFATGDFIYQVYVDTPSYFRDLKKHISRTGLAGMDSYERDLIFSPWHTLHVGKILSASGTPSLEAWAEENLEGSYRSTRDERYSSIVQIYSDSQLTQQLDDLLEDSALLRMEFQISSPVFENLEIREWFEEHVRKRLNESIAKVSNKQ